MIQLPDLRQQHDYDCGSVCCRIVWHYFKVARKNTLTTEIDGTDPRAIESAMRISGLPVISGTMTLADLAWFTRTKRPVIVLATCSTEPIGHYMVCGGQRDRRLHFQCPSRGPIAETPRRFDKRWHDVDRLGTRYSRWGIVVG